MLKTLKETLGKRSFKTTLICWLCCFPACVLADLARQLLGGLSNDHPVVIFVFFIISAPSIGAFFYSFGSLFRSPSIRRFVHIIAVGSVGFAAVYAVGGLLVFVARRLLVGIGTLVG